MVRTWQGAAAAWCVELSGATTRLTVHPPVARTADLSTADRLVARTVQLVAAGYQDPTIARQLTAEGFRSARLAAVPTTLVTRLRRQEHQPSLTTRFRRQEKKVHVLFGQSEQHVLLERVAEQV